MVLHLHLPLPSDSASQTHPSQNLVSPMAETEDRNASNTASPNPKKRYLVTFSAENVKRPKLCNPAQALASALYEFGEHGGVNMSIEASATFTVMEPETMRRMFAGDLGPDRDFFIYSRHFKPTVQNLSRQIAAIEGTEAAYCTSRGMAAISFVLLQICSSGGHLVVSNCLYGGTHALLTHFLPRACNITTTFMDVEDLKAVRAAIREGETTVLYVESVSNPTLKVANIPELCVMVHERGEVGGRQHLHRTANADSASLTLNKPAGSDICKPSVVGATLHSNVHKTLPLVETEPYSVQKSGSVSKEGAPRWSGELVA